MFGGDIFSSQLHFEECPHVLNDVEIRRIRWPAVQNFHAFGFQVDKCGLGFVARCVVVLKYVRWVRQGLSIQERHQVLLKYVDILGGIHSASYWYQGRRPSAQIAPQNMMCCRKGLWFLVWLIRIGSPGR